LEKPRLSNKFEAPAELDRSKFNSKREVESEAQMNKDLYNSPKNR